MEEHFRRYPETTLASPEERKGSRACVVSHPDAGGECRRPAVGEVWSLPFCEIHGREAGLAAQEEAADSEANALEVLQDAEAARYERNRAVEETLRTVATWPMFAGAALDAAIEAAYPPEELAQNTDPDTLRYDYERTGQDGPHDWWCEAQFMACRFMRQAHDAANPGLLRDLEYVRERATVQRVLASRDLRLRWEEPRREARARASQG